MAKAWYQIRLTLLGRKATGTGCTGQGIVLVPPTWP